MHRNIQQGVYIVVITFNYVDYNRNNVFVNFIKFMIFDDFFFGGGG